MRLTMKKDKDYDVKEKISQDKNNQMRKFCDKTRFALFIIL